MDALDNVGETGGEMKGLLVDAFCFACWGFVYVFTPLDCSGLPEPAFLSGIDCLKNGWIGLLKTSRDTGFLVGENAVRAEGEAKYATPRGRVIPCVRLDGVGENVRSIS
jgi:hypothetical protein